MRPRHEHGKDPMQALLIVAHGSRREASNEEVRRLAEKTAARAPAPWALVRHAFLELAGPSIPEALETLIAAGADEILVVPWFLAAGRHVREDIPARVDEVRHRHPEIRIHIAPHLGSAEGLIDALLTLAAESTPH